MNKTLAITTTPRDAHYKAQAEHYLTETRKVLKKLAAEREREARRRHARANIVDEVRAILYAQ